MYLCSVKWCCAGLSAPVALTGIPFIYNYTSMRRLKILCIILLTVFFFSGLLGVVVDFARGWSDGMSFARHMEDNGLVGREYIALDMNYTGSEPLRYSERNILSQDSLVLVPNNISILEFSREFEPLTPAQSFFQVSLSVLNWAIIIIYIVITVVFAKLILSFVRAKVFEKRIITLLNHTGLWFLVLAVTETVWQLGRHYYASSLVKIEGLAVDYTNCIDWNSLIIALVILVMTEILRLATSIKEEQDLTI